MKSVQRVAFIGNHLPRRCGIATFTHDLHRAVATSRPDLETCVVAMTDPGRAYDYPPAVRFQIREETIDDYVQAAEFLNKRKLRRCLAFSTNTEFSAARPAAISSSSCRASKCRSSRRFIRCWPNRRPPSAT